MNKFDFPEWLKDGRKHYLDYMRNVASQTFMAGLALLAMLNLRKLALDPGLIACALMFTALCVLSFAANWSTSFDNIFSQYFAWEKRARQHVNRQTTCLKKIDGAWKITHDHTSVPFYMDGSYKAAVDLKP